jgi:DNA invertase Pin-like site-specific DNA recombinase
LFVCTDVYKFTRYGVMGSIAQFERELMLEGQREGIAKAKTAGMYKGRQSTMTPETVEAIKARAAAGENKAALAREFGLSRGTVYNVIADTAVTA